jgi:TolA-binding protein
MSRRGIVALVIVVAGAMLLAGCSGPGGRRGATANIAEEDLWSGAPETPIARYDVAKKLFLGGRYSAAAGGFQRWLKTYAGNPLEPAVLYYLARSQFNAGFKTEAKATCAQLEAKHPKSDWVSLAHRDVTRPAKAYRRRTDGPKHRWWHPGDWFTPKPPIVQEFEAARVLFKRRHFEKSLPAFRNIAEQNPQSPLAPASWYYAARSYEYIAQLDKAREAYQHVIATYPETEWDWLAKQDMLRLKVE